MDILATWINTVVGIVGTIVGVMGWMSLNEVINIKNSLIVTDKSTIQNAQIINNGLDSYAVIRLSRDTTREELQKTIDELAKTKIVLDGGSAIGSIDKENK